jgi:hypothetical protein
MKYTDEPIVSFDSASKLTSVFKPLAITRVLIFQGERNFYFLLVHTILSFATFGLAVFIVTELRLLILCIRPHRYKPTDLLRGLIIGGFAKLLGLLSIVWRNITPEPHQMLIYGYTVLYLLTAYSGIYLFAQE